jgi:hypothetical protein
MLGAVFIAGGLVALAQSAKVPPAAPSVPVVRFKPGTEAEDRFLFRELNSQLGRDGNRFMDGRGYVVYRLPFAKGAAAALVLDIANEFLVEASDDLAGRFRVVSDFREFGEGFQRVTARIDLADFAAKTGLVYVKIGDAKPFDGFGGNLLEAAVEGPLAAAPPPPRVRDAKPVFVAGRESLYPRAKPPAGPLCVFDLNAVPPPDRILFASLQGLANADAPRLFLQPHGTMLRLLQERGVVQGTQALRTPAEVFERFPFRDAVVADPALPGCENVAATIAGAERLVIARPEAVATYGLSVKVDLRGRWKDILDAYRETYATYKSRLNRNAVAMIAPGRRDRLYDYVVAHRLFPFWIDGPEGDDGVNAGFWAQEEWFERVLAEEFPVNIPVLGYPWAEDHGIGENRGVELLSRCGKFLVPSDWVANLSALTAFPPRHEARPPRPARALQPDPGKAYATLLVSDGDNLCFWNGPEGLLSRYVEGLEGGRDFPVAFTLGSSIVDLMPPVADAVLGRIRATDGLGGAVSGVGYTYMGHYGKAFGTERPRVVREFIDLTTRYLGYCGQDWLWVMSHGDPGRRGLADYDGLAGVRAILHGYGREAGTAKEAVEARPGAPVFHSVTGAVRKEEVLQDVDAILARKERPLFLHVFVWCLGVDAAGCREIAAGLRARGVEIVTPAELAGLHAASRKGGAEKGAAPGGR